MQPILPSTSFNLFDWQRLQGGVRAGEFIMVSARTTGKSQMSKLIMNSMYGKTRAFANSMIAQLTIAKAYKGEWKVVLPFDWEWVWTQSEPAITDERFTRWCIDTFGPGGKSKDCRWRKSPSKPRTYFFRNESDLTMVTLRWAE